MISAARRTRGGGKLFRFVPGSLTRLEGSKTNKHRSALVILLVSAPRLAPSHGRCRAALADPTEHAAQIRRTSAFPRESGWHSRSGRPKSAGTRPCTGFQPVPLQHSPLPVPVPNRPGNCRNARTPRRCPGAAQRTGCRDHRRRRLRLTVEVEGAADSITPPLLSWLSNSIRPVGRGEKGFRAGWVTARVSRKRIPKPLCTRCPQFVDTRGQVLHSWPVGWVKTRGG